MKEKINPIEITSRLTGTVYTLEFSKESVTYAENRGFSIGDVADFPLTKLPDLFYYAFRKNHRNVPRTTTDAILTNELRGLKKEEIERIIQLYSEPVGAIIYTDDDEDGEEKNERATVQL